MRTSSDCKQVYIYNTTRQTFLATKATVANTYLSRLVGLLGKTGKWARPGQGLWIVPSCGVHTFGMLFSIDLVFLDRNRQVVHLEESLAPFRVSKVSLKATSVVELPPHTIYRTRTQVGDHLEIELLKRSDSSGRVFQQARSTSGEGARENLAVEQGRFRTSG